MFPVPMQITNWQPVGEEPSNIKSRTGDSVSSISPLAYLHLVGRGMFLFRLLNLLAYSIFLAWGWLFEWPLANWLPTVYLNG